MSNAATGQNDVMMMMIAHLVSPYTLNIEMRLGWSEIILVILQQHL